MPAITVTGIFFLQLIYLLTNTEKCCPHQTFEALEFLNDLSIFLAWVNMNI